MVQENDKLADLDAILYDYWPLFGSVSSTLDNFETQVMAIVIYRIAHRVPAGGSLTFGPGFSVMADLGKHVSSMYHNGVIPNYCKKDPL